MPEFPHKAFCFYRLHCTQGKRQYLDYLNVDFPFFAQQGQHVALKAVKFGVEASTKFHPKTVNFTKYGNTDAR